MKKKIAAFLAALTAAVLLCCTAGAFDANDYDYSYDDSSWDSDWSGGWDDDDDDYSFVGGTSSSGGGGSFGGTAAGFIVAVIIIAVICLATISKNKSGSSGKSVSPPAMGGVRPANGGQGRNVRLPDRTAEITRIIQNSDPDFTADDFTAFAKEVYMDIQTAWCKRDLTPVRPVLHTNLYNTTCKQVQSKIDQGVIYHYESIAINTAYLTSYVRDTEYEYLTVYLNARFIDYQTDEKTGNILRGDKNTRWDFRYKMKFMRTFGVKTKAAGTEHGHNCPNCGAPLEISSTGQCPYCGSTVTTGLYSWVLSDFMTIRDDTVDDGIRVPPEPEKKNEDGAGQGGKQS